MLLKRLELAGFKSFARPTTLVFSSPITAIVGPNGSGKSNISEAVRFVLGEQSMKSLRGKRGEDLIFNGTHSVSRQEKASVAIVFDNARRVFNVDYDEVVIKRIVYRDSTSEYLVNGSRVRLKDILELLSSIHIGASSHHIISQGEADRILLASFKERRSMIEDALGLKIYHYKKQESERKLLRTNENLSHVQALRREIEPHLNFLEKQVAKIKHAETLREELKKKCALYIASERTFLKKERDKIDDEKDAPERELESLEGLIRGKEQSIKSLISNKEVFERVEKAEKNLEETRRKKEELSRALGRIEGAIEYEERKLQEEEKKAVEKKEATVPRESLERLQESLENFFKQAEAENDVGRIKALLYSVREMAIVFFNTFLVKFSSGASLGSFRDSLEARRREQRTLSENFSKISQEENLVRKEYEALKKDIEAGTGKEREIERELFNLKSKKTELVTKLELLRIRENQYAVQEDFFERFTKEASALVGTIPEEKEGGLDFSDRKLEESTRHAIEKIKIKLEEVSVGGSDVLKEYQEVKERSDFLKREIEDLEKSAGSLMSLIKELEEKIKDQFKAGISKINKHFQELFVLMFGGGKASISIILPPKQRKKPDNELEEEILDQTHENASEEELEEGVDIDVSLPRKKIRGLHMLSGGERSLVSIALIFAMTKVNPPPFLILDETDAALDEVNSRKYGEMLKNLSRETELILITHNRETMSCAGVLYGVTAIDGVSRVLSVRFDEAETLVENNG